MAVTEHNAVLQQDITVLLEVLGTGNVPQVFYALASLKRLERVIKAATIALLPRSNKEFAGAAFKQNDGSSIKPFSKGMIWTFPDDIKLKEEELKELKKISKQQGIATSVAAKFNPDEDKSFSVTAPFEVANLNKKELLQFARILKADATAPSA